MTYFESLVLFILFVGKFYGNAVFIYVGKGVLSDLLFGQGKSRIADTVCSKTRAKSYTALGHMDIIKRAAEIFESWRV